MTVRPTRPSQAYENRSRVGADHPASQSHLPGEGHDERGQYGKGAARPDNHDGARSQPTPKK